MTDKTEKLKYYFNYSANNNGNFTDNVVSCLKYIIETKGNQFDILYQTFFIDAQSKFDFINKKQLILNYFADSGLGFVPTSVVGQKPYNSLLACEFVLVNKNNVQIINQTVGTINYCRANFKTHTEIIAFGLTNNLNQSTYNNSDSAFKLAQQVLETEGLTFADIVRQWNYIEDITFEQVNDGVCTQNYQAFNNIRSKYYNSSQFTFGYPAATGIGMDYGGVVIDFIAVKPSNSVSTIAIANPLQIDAHNYSHNVLVGQNFEHNNTKTTPKFERAKLLCCGSNHIFVSGTAAIIGENTVTTTSIAEQTAITIDNINKLVSETNLQKHKVYCKTQTTCVHLRVYVRNGNNCSTVKQTVEKLMPNVPFILVYGNVCRNNLLVEIEAVFTC